MDEIVSESENASREEAGNCGRKSYKSGAPREIYEDSIHSEAIFKKKTKKVGKKLATKKKKRHREINGISEK